MDIISTWQKTQNNGSVMYEKFPAFNLSTDGRKISNKFKKFCKYNGVILDVGSGPVVPSYLKDNDKAVLSIGIDPLIKTKSIEKNVSLMRSVGEYLPFKDDSFDVVSFMTSFDHVIDPVTTLNETKRILRSGGYAIFCVENNITKKHSVISIAFQKILNKTINRNKLKQIQHHNDLVESLETIPDCVDKFHLRHIKYNEFIELVRSLGFRKIEQEGHPEIASVFLKFSRA